MTPALRFAAALACALAFAAAARGEDAPALPPGVVARVYGRDIPEEKLLERLARRHENSDQGRKVLEQIVDDVAVAREAARRGVTVTDAEARDYMKKVDETIRRTTGNDRSLEDVFREEHTNETEFLGIAREYLVRQRMAVEDLGAKPGEEVPEHRMKLWTSTLRRRAEVRFTDLPEGVLASVGDATIDRVRFARALRDRLPVEIVTAVRDDLVLEAAAAHRMREAELEITDDDLDREIERLRVRFSEDPRVRGTGVTFDQFLLQTRGTGEADLRNDESFRARVGLERLLRSAITDEQVRRTWEENRDAYGERALVRQIHVPAAEEGGKFEMATFRQAYELALRAKVAVLEGTGATGGKGAAQKRPLGEVVASVAKQFETDAEKRRTAGEPVGWTRLHLAGEDALAAAVFEGALGVLVGPLRSTVGYHLLVVEERRAAPPFEDVRGAVRDDLLRKAASDFRLALRGDENVVVAE